MGYTSFVRNRVWELFHHYLANNRLIAIGEAQDVDAVRRMGNS